MVRLTADVIAEAAQLVNPCRERELNLRSYKFSVVENLGATLDQFDTINMNDNDIKKLENFPYFQRLKILYVANNRIRKISPDVAQSLPNLEELVLNNNEIKDLADIDPLAELPNLEYLSLLGCPMCAITNYRLYVIFKLKTVRVLDYRRVKKSEREAANKMFSGSKGDKLLKEIANTFVPGGELDDLQKRKEKEMPAADREKIKAAILQAKTLEEVEMLQQQLQAGVIPGKRGKKAVNPEVEEEEDEEEEEGEKMQE